MPTDLDSISAAISEASSTGFRERLIARGQARSMIWRDGILPPDAPPFSRQLSYDLHSYGYTLLDLGLRLVDMGGDYNHARIAFEQSATALESVIAKGIREESDRDFHFVIAAAAYHLAHLSARAYSLLSIVKDDNNFSPPEKAVSLLMQRDTKSLRKLVYDFRIEGNGSDESISRLFRTRFAGLGEAPDDEYSDEISILFDGLDLALTDSFFAGFSNFLLALERGEPSLVGGPLTT